MTDYQKIKSILNKVCDYAEMECTETEIRITSYAKDPPSTFRLVFDENGIIIRFV